MVASPAFLGHLRRNFGKPLAECIELTVDKDFTTDTPTEIFRRALAERDAQSRESAGS